eukprot:CAMPEP_0172356662 /NCGR_PEP_ID=MMETSP1060-20121228/1042_1 /TAXON_ID=37318 /ORGANISM="Pseudo-nitzschia pungens, Strain cf. cingulata" /LENGTH=309 /DNA_ID=CAMNT_0013076909 /DNA_START=209 /DNA_END=1138 /DNA_ORIENTATION=+
MSAEKKKTTTQVLQISCQKNGWGFAYGTEETTGNWTLDVYYAMGKSKRFVVTIPRSAKFGKSVVSEEALRGLGGILVLEASKRIVPLSHVFPGKILIFDSAMEGTWQRFWTDSPTEVGIDCEGNQISPPVLVQISTEYYTILEVPRNGQLSDNLRRLLETESIVKVFCDNFSDRDKICLGLDPKECGGKNGVEEVENRKSHIADIEMLSREVMGPSNTPRGLSNLVSLCFPELNLRIEKPGRKARLRTIGKFVAIEQGRRKPLEGLRELKDSQKQYAALDAFCTLKIYQRLCWELKNKQDWTHEVIKIG